VVVALGVQRGGTDANARGMTVATVVGVQDTIRLPDGTVAVLAPESRLAIGPAFGASARDVTLDGMAHFTVVHDDARPFTVHAGGAAVRDIGTAFVVRVDGVQGGERVTVEVTDGQVMLRGGAAGADSVLLARGDRGVLAPGGTLTAARGAVTAGATAWTAGRLVYADTPIELVRADLRRWYGVNLLVADSALAGARVTATFDREPVERVLRLLALALGASVTRQGDLVVLRGSGAAP